MNTGYFMDDEREAHRLTAKVDEADWVARYFLPSLHQNAYFLDVGCGPGVIIKECARLVRTGQGVGIDISTDRIEVAKRNCKGISNVRFVPGSAVNIPFDNDTFDVVYSRFLLEYLPNPQIAVGEMKRVCKPGGTVILQDLDGQLLWHYPEDADLQQRIEIALEHLGKTGFDPLIGRKLFWMLKQASFDEIEVIIEPYHFYPGRISDKEYREWELKLDIAKSTIAPVFGEKEAERLKADFLMYLSREDTFTYSNLVSAYGHVT
jgi:ubiquinone/menaquinone biosynthesis C-methylase UbiE